MDVIVIAEEPSDGLVRDPYLYSMMIVIETWLLRDKCSPARVCLHVCASDETAAIQHITRPTEH